MSQDYLRKALVEMSAQDKAFVEGALTHQSNVKQITISEALAQLIEEAVLPANDTAKSICRKLYASDINSVEALRQFFSTVNTLRASQTGCPYYALEAVELLQALSVNKYKSFSNNDNAVRKDLISTLSSLCVRLITDDEATSFESTFKRSKEELEKANDVFDIEAFLIPVIKYWEVLAKYQEIFDILCSVCLVLNTIYTDTKDNVYKSIELIKALSQNWD